MRTDQTGMNGHRAGPAGEAAGSRRMAWLFFLLLLVLVFFLLDIFLGSVRIPFRDVLVMITGREGGEELLSILYSFRIPKALTAMLAGTALSVSGLQMQTIFRNPLAGPYVLGISAGASLGVAVLVMGMGLVSGHRLVAAGSSWAMALAAWLGSGSILLLIFALSGRVKDIMTILILGIMFGSATTALVSILQYFSTEPALKAFVVWTLGSLGSVMGVQLRVLTITVVAGLILVLFSTKILNVMLLGDEYARTMGVNIRVARLLIFLSTSILAGSVTAFCGPIGFIGIAVPHIARLILRTSNHAILVPGTMLTGAVILLLSDIIAQLPGTEKILPINAITALVGIPVIVWIILKKQKSWV